MLIDFLAISLGLMVFSASPTVVASVGSLLWGGVLLGSISQAFRKRQWFMPQWLGWPLGLYILATALSALDAYIPAWAWGKTLSLVGMAILLGVLFPLVKSWSDYQKLAQGVWWGILVLLIFGVYQFAIFFTDYWLEPIIPWLSFLANDARSSRLTSLFMIKSGINVYACFLALYGPWFVAKSWEKHRWLGILAVGLLLFNALNTASRAYLIALSGSVLIWALLEKCFRFWVLSILVVAVFLGLSIAPVRNTMVSLNDPKDISNIEHSQTLTATLAHIRQHPINGWGADHTSRRIRKTAQGWVDGHDYNKLMAYSAKEWTPTMFYEKKAAALKQGVIQIDSPHNMFLWMFVDLGVLGFSAFLFLLGRIGFSLWHMYRRHADVESGGLLLGYLSFLLYGLFQDSLNAPIMVQFFLIFMLLVAWRKKLLVS